VNEQQIRGQIADAENLGILRTDSEAQYPYSQSDLAETILRADQLPGSSFIVDSKAMFSNAGEGNPTAEAVRAQD
jgi:hypothetical protein